jgi:hypothetical protein
MKRIFAVAAPAALAVLAASLLFAACGGNDGDDGDGQTVERTTCQPAEPVTPHTPADLPQGVAEYQSPERGYLVRYPDDWAVEPNGVAVQNIAGDVFYALTGEDEVKPNISVSCETIPVGTTSQAFFDSKAGVVERIVGIRPEVKRTLTVDGKEGFLVEYPVRKERTPEPLQIDKVEVYFADDLGGWTIALVVPEGMVEQYRAIFDDFVSNFDGS